MKAVDATAGRSTAQAGELSSPCLLATCCLPWTESFELDVPAFRRQIARQIAAGIEHLYLFGTAGEGHAVTLRQFEKAAEVFVEASAGKAKLRQLGVIGLSLPQVCERIDVGRSLGISSYQISFPAWGRLSDFEVADFFEGTCGRYPACSFLFYNVARGLRLLSPAEIGATAARYENLVAVKWAMPLESVDLPGLAQHAPRLNHFFTDINFVDASLRGVRCSLLMALTAANPRIGREIFELGTLRGDDQRLRQLLDELERHRQVIRSLEMFGSHMDGAFDKLYCRLHDGDFQLRLLPPYRGACEESFRQYRDRLLNELPHWLDA